MTRIGTTAVATAPRPASVRPATAGPSVDPLRLLRQNAKLLSAVAAIGLVFGVILFFILNIFVPRFSGTVYFELPPVVSGAEDLMAIDSRNEDIVVRMAQTEAARLTSRDILTRAMRGRDIEQTKWSEWFRDASGAFVIDDAVDELEEDLGAGHQRDTLYFTLAWSASDAADVPVVLNRIADTYMESKSAEENARFASDLRLLRDREKDIDRQLTLLGNDIATFISQNNITALDERLDQGRTAIQNLGLRINETKSMLSLLVARRNQTQAKLQGTLEPSSDDRRLAESDPEVMRVSAELRNLRMRQSTSRERFSPDHPEVRAIDQMVRSAESERNSAIDSIIQRNLTADFKEVTDQIESYTGLLESLDKDFEVQEARLKTLAADMAELEAKQARKERLETERTDVARQISELEQFRRRESARAVTIAQRATTPRETAFPKIYVIVPLSMLGFVGLTFGFLFTREFLDQRVKYPSDLAAIHGCRILGTIPERTDDPTNPARAEMVVREQPSAVLAESFRQTATAVQRSIDEAGIRSILITGGLPESGTSTVASNLAASLVAGGRRVLLVDANFRRPRLGEMLGQASGHPGLGDLLCGAAKPEEAICDCGGGLHLLPAGTEMNRVVERLNTGAMGEVLEDLGGRYDVVLIDTAPWVIAGDAQAVAAKVDATLLVVRAWQEQRGLVARLAGQLAGSKAAFLGVVFNRPRNTAGGYFRKNFEAMARYSAPKSN
ncbi:MAG: GumC family protein [Phycisphaerales bacterium]|jgi:succinoglycan biosynthesis transport protein ExoP